MADGERWLVLGLGNPDNEYGGTRHNVGSDVVRRLAERLGVSLKAHKARANVAETRNEPGGPALVLAVPHGYMNKSGGPAEALAQFYKVDHERLVVVHDDLDLELGRIRLKRGGGTAGHNGLKDIAQRTGSPDFLRVRVGIGRPQGRQPARDYVLKRFGAHEQDDAELARERGGDAVLDLVASGLEAAQNRHHAG
ncbi:aminoacyl-tRNA hydrolase [Egibacter rhizosphaerae]|uniref:Peptidyl-tRNA hydrolase n=1 Tax=Egibacter rhizosphaerae TaxID=1670831 RepID=A0A411YLM9_9ACTN|nr:aminoacyl-tRNA hydrolase [Egibacter rhizosphaerae]